MFFYKNKMNLLIHKVVEVLSDQVRDRVPETGPFQKVFVTYQHPDPKLKGLLAVEEDLTSAANSRRLLAGMFPEGSSRVVSNYLFKGTKQEILDWLANEKHIPELMEVYEHLKQKAKLAEY